jgi:hypothetical protein
MNPSPSLPQSLKQSSFLGCRLLRKPLVFIGERGGNRTHDPLIKSQMLYLLSYALASRLEGVGRAYSLAAEGSTDSKRGGARALEPGEVVAGVVRGAGQRR